MDCFRKDYVKRNREDNLSVVFQDVEGPSKLSKHLDLKSEYGLNLYEHYNF